MDEISNCPKCGATVTVDTFQEGDPMGIFCSACGFVFFVPQEVDTVEELISSWNAQPVIERLRAEYADMWSHDANMQLTIHRLCAEVEKLRNNTYCAYCGEEFGLGDFDKATKDVTEHIYTCEKHPLTKLRAGVQFTLDLARTGLKPDHYASEVEWLQHKINVIASELAGLLKG
jgi:DNA-directed RNA polymerase subunit RPC12/RpoP